MKPLILLIWLTGQLMVMDAQMIASTYYKQKDAKIGIGLKGGVNFANVTNAASVNSSSRTGFMVGGFFSPATQGVLGYRTELIFSRQGYDYKKGSNTGTVDLDYILLPQLTTISIGRFLQLQLGAQMAFLINAKADSSQPSTGNPYADKMMDYYNRIDYGLAGGVELTLVKGLLIGARYNISLGKLYKDPPSPGTPIPPFIPDLSKTNPKNNVVQLFAGYKF